MLLISFNEIVHLSLGDFSKLITMVMMMLLLKIMMMMMIITIIIIMLATVGRYI